MSKIWNLFLMSYQSFSYFYGKALWNEYLTCESRYYSLQRAGIVTPWSMRQTVPGLWSGGILLGGHAVLSSGRGRLWMGKPWVHTLGACLWWSIPGNRSGMALKVPCLTYCSGELPCLCAQVFQSCPALSDHTDCSQPGFSVLGFSRQEYRSGLPFPSPGNLPDPGIEPVSLKSAALSGRFFTTAATWEALSCLTGFRYLSRRYQSLWVRVLETERYGNAEDFLEVKFTVLSDRLDNGGKKSALWSTCRPHTWELRLLGKWQSLESLEEQLIFYKTNLDS